MNSQLEFIGVSAFDNQIDQPIAASADKTVTFTPPEGETWQICGVYIQASDPSGSASGTHKIELLRGIASGAKTYYLRALANTGNNIAIRNLQVQTADTSIPADTADQIHALLNTWITNGNALDVTYSNDTDVSQTANCPCRIIFKRYKTRYDSFEVL